MSIRARVYFPDYDAEHERVLKEFAQGIPGAQVVPVDAYSPPRKADPFDVAVIYGDYKYQVEKTRAKQRVIHGQHSAGCDVVYVDSGYIGRGNGGFYSVGLNGMHGNGLPYWQGSPPNRWRALNQTITPLQNRPQGKIILIGQVPWDANVQYNHHERWLTNVFQAMLDMFGPDRVLFRPHPKARHLEYEGIPEKYTVKTGDLSDDLQTAAGLVCYNSNSAIDAALAGVPVVVLGHGAMAQRLGLGSIQSLAIWLAGDLPQYDAIDREQVFQDIAYGQWTEQEMRTGQVWGQLVPMLKRHDFDDPTRRRRR